ncbi:unnamed protein product [Rotaria magnacalcarata]
MNKRHFHFQDLPVERFRHIFKYLARHDLVNPFERLNQQFDIMFAQQPLCLPNNQQMSIQLYCHYLKKIVSKHASQIVYFHLSERSAPCATDYFLGVVGENISHLLRIAQRSPYFSGLYIELDLDYGRVLSLNKQLGSLLSRQLVILHLTAEKPNSSPGDLVRIIDKLGVGEFKQSATIFIPHTHLHHFK